MVASLKLRGFADEELGAALGDLERTPPLPGRPAGRGTGRARPGTLATPAHRPALARGAQKLTTSVSSFACW